MQNMKIVCIFSKVLSKKHDLHKTWFFFFGVPELLSKTPNLVCVFVWSSWALGFRFLISCDGENRIIEHSTIFSSSLNATLEWQELLLFPMDLLIHPSFTQVWQWWVHQRHQIKVRKWKIFTMLCVFSSIISLLLMCLVCIFLLLKLCQQAQGVLCDYRCFALCFRYHHTHVLVVCLPSQIILALSLALLSSRSCTY